MTDGLRNRMSTRLNTRLNTRLRALPAVLAATAMLGWGAVFGVPLLVADLQTQAARQKVHSWARQNEGWTVEEWQAVRAALLGALEITPRDPMLHATLAQLYATQGQLAWADEEQRLAYFSEALLHQQQALALRPTDGFTWLRAALSMYALDRPAAEMHHAWAQAAAWAPREADVQRGLVDLCLAGWAQATPEMRAWVQQAWQQATPVVRKRFEDDARKWGMPEVFQAPAG